MQNKVLYSFRPLLTYINRAKCLSLTTAANYRQFHIFPYWKLSFNYSLHQLNRRPTTSYSFSTNGMEPNVEHLINEPQKHYDYKTLIERKKNDLLIVIDVRQPEELLATGTIPDSINIPLAELENALGSMSPEEFRTKYSRDKPPINALLVFSCQSGRRSLKALSAALQLGYYNAVNYKGGWIDWESHSTCK